jgi:hypothetical protein
MQPTKMTTVRPRASRPRTSDRLDGRLMRVVQARRRLEPPRTRGRAWINGREAGGTDSRYAHLGQSYD